MTDDLVGHDAVALGELVRRREVTPTELLDLTILRLAAQLEEARPWAHRRPAIHCASVAPGRASR